jgi:hypothetical protein
MQLILLRPKFTRVKCLCNQPQVSLLKDLIVSLSLILQHNKLECLFLECFFAMGTVECFKLRWIQQNKRWFVHEMFFKVDLQLQIRLFSCNWLLT